MVDKDKVQNEGIPKYFERNKKSVSPPNTMTQVTEAASSLNISESSKKRLVCRKNVIPECVQMEDVRRSPRLLKRARSTVDEVCQSCDL